MAPTELIAPLNKLVRSQVEIFSRVEAYLTPDQAAFLGFDHQVCPEEQTEESCTARNFQRGRGSSGVCERTFGRGEGHAPVVLLQGWYCLFLGLDLQLAAVLQNKLLLTGAVR